MTLSQQLAQYASGTGFARIPDAPLQAARTSVLDTLAVAWAGTTAPGCPEVRALHAQRGGRAESAVWGTSLRMPAASAALVNGLAAAALDFDSMHIGLHADACTLAAALAVAEREGASGAELLRAFVIGSDIASRIASASRVRDGGWWDTPVIAGFGAAAAAGLLLGLDAPRIAHAFGLVFARTGGTLQLNVDQSLAKRLAIGQAAQAGVEAALLAQAGITGPAQVFEGEFGFSRVYGAIDATVLLAGLGESFAASRMTFKPYPSCGCVHTAIEAALRLMREQRLAPGDVAAICVSVSPYMHALVGGPFDPAGGEVAAQFSLRYAIACAIHRGGFTLADLEPAAMAEPAVVSTARKVEVRVDTRSDSTRACVLELRVAGGAAHRLAQADAPGSPEMPMSAQQQAAKVSDCFARGIHPLTPAAIEAVAASVRKLHELPFASDLTQELQRACE